MYFNKPIDQLTPAEFDEFIRRDQSEKKTLDYKLTMDIGTDAEKKEFLKDVVSLANTNGGLLVYGVEELRDSDGRKTGLPGAVFGLDGYTDEKRLAAEQILKSGLAPRVPGVVISPPVGSYSKGPVGIVQVPRSVVGPHMVAFRNDESRFWARHSNGKYAMDIDEIRDAFNLSQSLIDRISAFRAERVAKVVGADPTADALRVKLVLHLLPVASFDRRTTVDVASDLMIEFKPPLIPALDESDGGNTDSRFNLEGLLLTRYVRRPDFAKGGMLRMKAGTTQFFRSGVVEIAADIRAEDSREMYLPLHFGKRLAHSFWKHLVVLKSLQVPPPLVVGLTLVGASMWKIYPVQNNEKVKGQSQHFGHDPLVLPEVYLENLDGTSIDLMRPVLDALWQSGGWERYFGETGFKYEGE